jgi:hypothetical protein
LEKIPDLSTNGPVHGLWKHLRVKENGSAAAMLMKASKSAEQNISTNKNEKNDDKFYTADITNKIENDL